MKDIKHIRGIFIWPPGSCPRGGTWRYHGGLGGSKKKFFQKFNQIWCVSYVHECNSTIFWVPAPWGLGEGPKGQISLNLNYKVNFKDFKPKFVYLLTNERYQTYQTVFSFGRLGHASGAGLGSTVVVGGQKKIFPKFNQI